MKNLENFNLKELSFEEQKDINGGAEITNVGNGVYQNPDGTRFYTGGNELVYLAVAAHNAAIYAAKAVNKIASWFD